MLQVASAGTYFQICVGSLPSYSAPPKNIRASSPDGWVNLTACAPMRPNGPAAGSSWLSLSIVQLPHPLAPAVCSGAANLASDLPISHSERQESGTCTSSSSVTALVQVWPLLVLASAHGSRRCRAPPTYHLPGKCRQGQQQYERKPPRLGCHSRRSSRKGVFFQIETAGDRNIYSKLFFAVAQVRLVPALARAVTCRARA